MCAQSVWSSLPLHYKRHPSSKAITHRLSTRTCSDPQMTDRPVAMLSSMGPSRITQRW